MSHVYHAGGYLNQILDDGDKFNHSDNPNSSTEYPGKKDQLSSFALRDIKKGEQICEDYGGYDHPDWFVKLYKEFNVVDDYTFAETTKLIYLGLGQNQISTVNKRTFKGLESVEWLSMSSNKIIYIDDAFLYTYIAYIYIYICRCIYIYIYISADPPL